MKIFYEKHFECFILILPLAILGNFNWSSAILQNLQLVMWLFNLFIFCFSLNVVLAFKSARE